MNQEQTTLSLPDTSERDAAPASASGAAADAARLQAAEWERMVRIRGARHAGPATRRTSDERPR